MSEGAGGRRDTGTGTDTDTDTGAGTGTGTPNREDQQDREQSFFIVVIHSHLSFSQRSIRNSFHSLRPSSVGSEAARRKKQQSREWKQKHGKCYARRKQKKEEGLSLEADQTANHQVRFARRCAASNRIGPAKPLPLFHGVNNNFLGILPCDQRITGSQCSTGVFSVRKLALVSPRSRGGVRCPVPAP